MTPHPEDFCEQCGRPNPSWWTDSDRFNLAMGSYSPIVCPSCFVAAHEAATGLVCTWKLEPGVFRHHTNGQPWCGDDR